MYIGRKQTTRNRRGSVSVERPKMQILLAMIDVADDGEAEKLV
jgi:hypothetical protein